MKRTTSKIALLFGLYLAAHFTDACLPICDCPTVEFPFFDYKKIVLETNNPAAAGYLSIDISPDSVTLVAQAAPQFHFMTSAYGCKCIYDGYEGDKYSPLAIDVFADKDFNDTLPAGASLRSVFYGGTQGDILAMLTSEFRPNRFNSMTNKYSVSTAEKPIHLGEPYHFQIQWVKSNGDTLVAETGAVIFN